MLVGAWHSAGDDRIEQKLVIRMPRPYTFAITSIIFQEQH
jgi:hypothetical protein